MRQHTNIASDHNRWRQAIGRIDPCALGKSNQHGQQKKGADPGLDHVDQPPASDRQQRGARGRRNHGHHIDSHRDIGNLAARGRFAEPIANDGKGHRRAGGADPLHEAANQ
jgi:hypothetical protein